MKGTWEQTLFPVFLLISTIRCQQLGIKCYYLTSKTEDSANEIKNRELNFTVELLEHIMNCMERDLYLLQNDKALPQPTNKSTKKDVTKNWKFELRKDGGFSIHTDILSHTSLLDHIKQFSKQRPFIFPLIKQPTLATLSAGGGYLLRHTLSSALRKENIKAILRSIEKKKKQPPLLLTAPSNAFEKKDVLQIIDCYFDCCYLNRVIFHKKTFYHLFVPRHSKAQISKPSPVVYALAAAVLTMRCKHILSIIPYDQQMPLAEYYFDKAHHALKFDEPTIETMIIYLQLAVFKANTMQPDEAKIYLELGLRTRHLLSETVYAREPPYYTLIQQQPHSDEPPTKKIPRSRLYNKYLGEYENFHRLLAGFQDCARFLQFVHQQRGVPLHRPSDPRTRLFQHIMKEQYHPHPLPDETKNVVRAVLKENHIYTITAHMKSFFPRVRHGSSDIVPLSLIMDTEEKLTKAYHHLPQDFQLNPAIFEDGLSDAVFRARLVADGRCDAHSVSIALKYYHALLSVHEPFLPLMDEQEVSVYGLRAQTICYHTAIKMIRLLEYQCTAQDVCAIARPMLLAAWDIMRRNACLEVKPEYMSTQEIKLAREYTVRCAEILRMGHMYNAAEREIESQLLVGSAK